MYRALGSTVDVPPVLRGHAVAVALRRRRVLGVTAEVQPSSCRANAGGNCLCRASLYQVSARRRAAPVDRRDVSQYIPDSTAAGSTMMRAVLRSIDTTHAGITAAGSPFPHLPLAELFNAFIAAPVDHPGPGALRRARALEAGPAHREAVRASTHLAPLVIEKTGLRRSTGAGSTWTRYPRPPLMCPPRSPAYCTVAVCVVHHQLCSDRWKEPSNRTCAISFGGVSGRSCQMVT